MKKLTKEEFIERAKLIHGDKYDYSLVEYKNMRSDVKIYCKKCKKYFYQNARNHLGNHGCKDCGNEIIKQKLSKTTEQFIEEAKKVHGNKYDYNLVNYKNNRTKVKIYCKNCKEYFFQTPKQHLRGCGCTIEADNILKTTEQFIKEAKKIHGDNYNYSLVEYNGAKTKIKIICNTCKNIFLQEPANHLNGQRCSYCFGTPKKTTEQFIEEAKLVHGNKYDYSLVEYNGRTENIKIICKKCNYIFDTVPYDHLNGYGCCPVCCQSLRVDTVVFINKARIVHGDKYDYSKVKYINAHEDVEIICPKHGAFFQKAYIHLGGYGCKKCAETLGESKIRVYLEKINKDYEYIKYYDDLKDKSKLSYDFYVPDNNLLIEFNGIQHYKFNTHFHRDVHEFHTQLHHDWLKRKYAKDHNINLLIIPYWNFDNIEKILEDNINEQ